MLLRTVPTQEKHKEALKRAKEDGRKEGFSEASSSNARELSTLTIALDVKTAALQNAEARVKGLDDRLIHMDA